MSCVCSSAYKNKVNLFALETRFLERAVFPALEQVSSWWGQVLSLLTCEPSGGTCIGAGAEVVAHPAVCGTKRSHLKQWVNPTAEQSCLSWVTVRRVVVVVHRCLPEERP